MGLYSLKAGYALGVNLQTPPPFQSSQPDHAWWSTLWQLSLPPKVRNFLWRACRDLIPAAANLASRSIWKNSLFWCYLKRRQSASFMDCALFIENFYSWELLELFVIMSWAIWFEVCSRSHVVGKTSSGINIDWVYRYLEAFRMASHLCPTLPLVAQSSSASAWTVHLRNQYRVDVDAGFDVGRHAFSVGAIIRDFQGSVVRAKAHVIRHPGSVKCAELAVILFGLKLCLWMGIYSAMIFSYSSSTID